MEERIEQRKGYKVKIRGDLAMYDKRMQIGDTDEARGGIAEVIESGKMAPVVISKHHRDPRTKMHNAVNKIRKFVNERPEHREAGFKTKAKDITKAVSNTLPQLGNVKRIGFGMYKMGR